MLKNISVITAFAALNLQPKIMNIGPITASPFNNFNYINTEISISDTSNSVLITPNFNHNYTYDEDERLILRFDYSENIIAQKIIRTEDDITFRISYETFTKAKSFRFDLIDDNDLHEGQTHTIEHVDDDEAQLVLGLNGNNSFIKEPMTTLYWTNYHTVTEWFICEFQNRYSENQYAMPIRSNINYSCNTEIDITSLTYQYDDYSVTGLIGKLEDGQVLTGEPISFEGKVQKGIHSKYYSDEHILVDPFAISQSVSTIAELEIGKVFKKKVKVFSYSVFGNPVVGHSSQANYSFVSQEHHEMEWDDEFYFGINTIDSIIGSGVTYENIFNHKV